MEKKENYRRLPNREDDNCFACGPTNPSGLRMEFFTDEEKVLSWVSVPKHMGGWNDIVHGGISSTILDEAMSWATIHLLKKFTLTKSITVKFLKPLHVEEELRVESRIRKVKNSREALMEGFVYNKSGELCAEATGIYALFTPDAVRKLGVLDENAVQGLEKVIR